MLLAALLGLSLRLHGLSSRGVWTDEAYTLLQATGHGEELKDALHSLSEADTPEFRGAAYFKSFMRLEQGRGLGDVSRGLLVTDIHPPLYFALIHLWMRVFTDSAVAARAFSLLAGLVSIPLAYILARELFTEARYGLLAAAGLAVNAFAVRYSQEARSYSLVVGLALLSFIFLLRLGKGTSRRDLFFWSALNALGLYTHYLFLALILTQVLYIGFAWRDKPGRLCAGYAGFLCTLVLFLPWLLPFLARGANLYLTDWIFGYPGFLAKGSALLRGLAGYLVVFDRVSFGGLTAGFIALGIFIYLCCRALAEKEAREGLFFCLTMSLLPLAAFFALDLSCAGTILGQERFWAFSFAGFVPFLGYVLGRSLYRNRLSGCLLIALMVFFAFRAGSLESLPSPARATAWVNQQAGQEKAAVFVYNIRSAVLSQAYYLDDRFYLVPLSSQEQLEKGVLLALGFLDKLYISHYAHSAASYLMDQPFMAIQDPESLGISWAGEYEASGVRVIAFRRRQD